MCGGRPNLFRDFQSARWWRRCDCAATCVWDAAASADPRRPTSCASRNCLPRCCHRCNLPETKIETQTNNKIQLPIDPLHLLSNPIASITQSHPPNNKKNNRKKKMDKSLPILYWLLITLHWVLLQRYETIERQFNQDRWQSSIKYI